MNTLFEKTAKKRRQKAILWTIVFHVALFGAVAYASSNHDKGVITTIKSWFGGQPEAVKDIPKA